MPCVRLEYGAGAVGEPCLYCEKRIEAGDEGAILPYLGALDKPPKEVAVHRACFLRALGIEV